MIWEYMKKNIERLQWLILILINSGIILLIWFACLSYTGQENERNIMAQKESFLTTVASVEKAVYGYMEAQQTVCDSWSIYINSSDFTQSEAIAYLSHAVSNAENMAFVIDSDNFRGISTVYDAKGNYEVDCSGIRVAMDVVNTLTDEVDHLVYVTSMFMNPINGITSVGFVRKVWLKENNGGKRLYYLIRVLPAERLGNEYFFPEEYVDAQLSLISGDGEYVIRAPIMKNDNFWDYMQSNNRLSEEEMENLRAEMIVKREVFTKKNSLGENAYYTCHPADDYHNWYFVGYIAEASLKTEAYDWTLLFFVTLGFIILIVFDTLQFVVINTRLKQSMEATRQANIAKSQFLSSMSHDIRTPMNAIIGMTTIATNHINDSEYVSDCLKKISIASNHLLTLVNDVLDISKIESGKMTLNPVVFSLPELISNLANIVRHSIKSKGLEFDIQIHKVHFENLVADEVRLNQIFINILSNAVKYTNNGGRIILDIEENVLANDPKNIELVYSVEDTGIGMSEEFQKNMYESFSRAVDTRIDKIQGSGLGLAITKQMVDLMGGTIDCESELGKGTKFTVRLKLGIAEQGEEDLVCPAMDILVVDDDEVFLESTKESLAAMKLNVDTVTGGKEALEMLAKRHELGQEYALVIIDWKMPDMDGIETARQIRKQKFDKEPILIISSYDWTEVEESAREAGVNGFINKPLFKSNVYYKIDEYFHFAKKTETQKDKNIMDFTGLHLLVAEDNDFNWEILSEILSLYGIKADRAANGEICVDMLSRAELGTYDAILMDVQMPVMNGREATLAIRRMEDAGKRNIPIIALTADAFSEDIKACLDVGMNGHVSKPIDPNRLFAELRKVGGVMEGRRR